jgi:hypothetical protein
LTNCGKTNCGPIPPKFGGRILFENSSSYNLFIALETIEKHEKLKEVIFLMEKDEKIILYHTFYGEREYANPAVYYTNILFYDLNNGNLLNKLNIKYDLFEIKEGYIDQNNAIFEIIIDDNFIKGIFYEK